MWSNPPKTLLSSSWFIDFIAAREHKEHRDSLRSLCSFVANQSAQDTAVLVLVY